MKFKRAIAKRTATRKYSPAVGADVAAAVTKMKKGKLKSSSGHTVTLRKQAIAIGLSEAREEGKRLPKRKSR